MTRYLPLKGIITSISESRTGGSGAASCTLLFSIQGEDGNVFSFVISPSTYVLNQESFRPGDTIIAFYDSMAPMPLIYPPSYQAVAAIKPWKEQSAMLDVFDQNLKNSDNSLVLNLLPPISAHKTARFSPAVSQISFCWSFILPQPEAFRRKPRRTR